MQVGDRVRYIRRGPNIQRPTGTIGIVVGGCDPHWDIRWPGSSFALACSSSHLEYVDTFNEHTMKEAHDYYTKLTEVEV